MRVNIEDDLRSSGRLSKLARLMKWNEREALGSLAMFWRHTQDAEVVTATRERIMSLIIVDYDTEGDANLFIDALEGAGLISQTESGKYLIRGNHAHVERIKRLRGSAVSGGLARQKKLNDFVATRLEDGSDEARNRQPSLSAPSPSVTPTITITPTDPPTEDPKSKSVHTRAREEDNEPQKVTPRTTRGFPESAFESEFREHGGKAGVTVAGFDKLELSIAGKLVMQCGREGLTQTKILAEWWRPEWRVCGWTVRQLEKHFAEVRAAVSDPKLRPRAKGEQDTERPNRYAKLYEKTAKMRAEDRELRRQLDQIPDEERNKAFDEAMKQLPWMKTNAAS